MPTPFVTCHYMNKFINPTKLVEVKYCNLPASMSFKEFNKKHRMPDLKTINITGDIRAMQKKDLSVVFKLWNKQQEKYKFRYKVSQEELMQYLLPKADVVWTYVIENMVDGKVQVTDFFSMHRLGQSCTSEGCKHKVMYSGFLYYYALTVNTFADIVK